MRITLDAWEASAETLEHKGQRIAFHCEGQGPPVLLLHGFPTSSFDYAGQWRGLTARFRVIAFDMIGLLGE